MATINYNGMELEEVTTPQILYARSIQTMKRRRKNYVEGATNAYR